MTQSGLFDSPLFTTLICLVLIYALLSLLVSTITEAINSYFQERGRLLYRTLGRLFEDGVNPNYGQLLYTHPMVEQMKKDKHSLPQYISPDIFAKAIIDLIGGNPPPAGFNGPMVAPAPAAAPALQSTFDRFEVGIGRMVQTPIKDLLVNMAQRCKDLNPQQPLAQLEKELKDWFNDQMQRLSGWYKTNNRTRVFVISLLVTVGLNVDSIHLFGGLYRNPQLRDRLLPVAESLATSYDSLRKDTSLSQLQQLYQSERAAFANCAQCKTRSDSSLLKRMDSMFLQHVDSTVTGLSRQDSIRKLVAEARQEEWHEAITELNDIESLGLPVGWSRDDAPLSWRSDTTSLLQKPLGGDYFYKRRHWGWTNLLVWLLGLAITALSLSAGAPFWFDMLLKLVNVRRTGDKPSTEK